MVLLGQMAPPETHSAGLGEAGRGLLLWALVVAIANRWGPGRFHAGTCWLERSAGTQRSRAVRKGATGAVHTARGGRPSQ
eukprot:scaffold132498_cov28-Tisochrysis_lutea.AAC.2